MSTERMSSRDWWDILITPWENNMSVPLLSSLSQGVDLQGAPLNTIHIGIDNGKVHLSLLLSVMELNRTTKTGGKYSLPGMVLLQGLMRL